MLITNDMTLSEAAVLYAQHGFKVFPLIPNGKLPVLKSPGNGQGGYKQATTDIAKIQEWWSQYPSANIGIACAASNIICVDPDTHKPDCAWSNFIADKHVPETLRATTVKGGQHLIYQIEDGVSYAGEVCEGVDTKANGYFVASPSTVNGKKYQWENDHPITVAPSWVPRKTTTSELPLVSDPPVMKLAEISELLNSISPDVGYDEWRQVLMAVHSATGGSREAFDLVNEWSSRGATYNAQEMPNKWLSFGGDRGVTGATLAAIAKKYGANVAEISHRHNKPDAAAVFGPAVPNNLPAEASKSLNRKPLSDFQGVSVPPMRWLVTDLIPAGCVTILSGDGATGKSLLSLQLAASVANDGVWLGKFTAKGPSIYITAEDSTDEIHRRSHKIVGGDFTGYDSLYHYSLTGEDAFLAIADTTGILHRTTLFHELEDEIKTLRPALVVLDNVADMFGGNENDKSQPRQFISILNGLCKEHGTTIVLLQHPSKSGMNDGSGTSGNTAWRNSARGYLYLSRVADDYGNEVNSDERILTTKKSNYGPSSGEIQLNYDDGKFVIKNPLADIQDNGQDDALFLTILQAMWDQKRYLSDKRNASNYAPREMAQHPLNSKGVPIFRLKKAMERLFMSGALTIGEYKSDQRKIKNCIEIVEETP